MSSSTCSSSDQGTKCVKLERNAAIILSEMFHLDWGRVVHLVLSSTIYHRIFNTSCFPYHLSFVVVLLLLLYIVGRVIATEEFFLKI